MGMLPIKFLTIHCAATPEGRDVKASTISEWDKAKSGASLVCRAGDLQRWRCDDDAWAWGDAEAAGKVGIVCSRPCRKSFESEQRGAQLPAAYRKSR